MKFKVLFLLFITMCSSLYITAQRGTRIGYIDTEYILNNFPEYQEAQNALEKRVGFWKTDVEKKLKEIELKKKELENERVLLTKELYDERLEDISFEEAEILDYQQKIFGPNGAFITQKEQLIQPIQDQIFAAVQDIAKNRKFDFIFDKSADVVMLYSNQAYDISDRVLKTLTRASKRKQADSKKERKALEEEELIPGVDREKEARQQELKDKKEAREAELEAKREQRKKQLEDKRKKQLELREARKREAEERRQKLKDARKAKQNEENSEKTTESKSTEATKTTLKDSTSAKAVEPKAKTSAELLEEKRQQKIKDREARQKALNERKQKIIEAKKKAKEERLKKIKKLDSLAKAKKNKQ